MTNLLSKYNHMDALVTMAMIALIAIAFRQTAVDLAGFGEAVGGILCGRGLHAAGSGWGEGQKMP